MEIFIDSANTSEIEKWLAMGVIDGVTTNPSIMFNDGVYDFLGTGLGVVADNVQNRLFAEHFPFSIVGLPDAVSPHKQYLGAFQSFLLVFLIMPVQVNSQG